MCLSPSSFQIKEQCKELIFSDEHMERLMTNFITEIEKGLKKETHPTADIKCFVTYVQELPNGQGEYVPTSNNNKR